MSFYGQNPAFFSPFIRQFKKITWSDPKGNPGGKSEVDFGVTGSIKVGRLCLGIFSRKIGAVAML